MDYSDSEDCKVCEKSEEHETCVTRRADCQTPINYTVDNKFVTREKQRNNQVGQSCKSNRLKLLQPTSWKRPTPSKCAMNSNTKQKKQQLKAKDEKNYLKTHTQSYSNQNNQALHETKEDRQPTSTSGTDNSLKCQLCEQAFTKPHNLKIHVQSLKHQRAWKVARSNGHQEINGTAEDTALLYICEVCDERFDEVQSFEEHINTKEHEIAWITADFEILLRTTTKSLSEHRLLSRSMKTTRISRPFKCEICKDAVFKTLNFFRKHTVTRTHQRQLIITHNFNGEQSKECSCQGCRVICDSIDQLAIHKAYCNATWGDEDAPVELPYECKICPAKWKDQQSLVSHMRSHLNNKSTFKDVVFKCKLCSEGYKSNEMLSQHLLSDEHIRAAKCDLCDIQIAAGSTHESHARTHGHLRALKHVADFPVTGDSFITCITCQKHFQTSKEVLSHFRCKHVTYVFKCEGCLISCTTLYAIMKHYDTKNHNEAIRKKHVNTINKKVESGRCTVTCNTRDEMQNFLLIEDIRNIAKREKCTFECNVCSVTFSAASEHLKSLKHQSREKILEQDGSTNEYACSVCDKKFSSREQIIVHVHSNKHKQNMTKFTPLYRTKIKTCNICDITFLVASRWKTHLKSERHNLSLFRLGKEHKSPEYNVTCLRCDETFYNFSTLEYHFKSSAHRMAMKKKIVGITKYPCYTCGYYFYSKIGLKIHLRTPQHQKKAKDTNEEVSVKCYPCDMAFNSQHDLEKHLLTDKRHRHDFFKRGTLFECKVCQLGFKHRIGYEEHLRNELHLQAWSVSRRQLSFWECRTCGMKFDELGQYSYHCRRHLTEERKKREMVKQIILRKPENYCNECNEIFRTKKDNNNHIVSQTHIQMKKKYKKELFDHRMKDEWFCFYCNKQFLTNQARSAHLLTSKHAKCLDRYLKYNRVGMMPLPLKCGLCDQDFGLWENLLFHLCSKNKTNCVNTRCNKYQCNMCNGGFSTIGSFQNHITADKQCESRPLTCSQCKIGFNTEMELKNHHQDEYHRLVWNARTETKPEKQIQCPYCKRSCKWQIELKKHIERRHQNNVKHRIPQQFLIIYNCIHCKFSSSLRSAVQEHRRNSNCEMSVGHEAVELWPRESDAKHACYVCNKMFSSRAVAKCHTEDCEGSVDQARLMDVDYEWIPNM